MAKYIGKEKHAVQPISSSQLLRVARSRGRNDTTSIGRNSDHDNNSKSRRILSSSSPQSSSTIYLVGHPYFPLPIGITEISGPSGVGKTQIGLSLCADCVSDKRRKAVYIQLGGSSRMLQTASRRLQSMIQSKISAAEATEATATGTQKVNGSSNKDDGVDDIAIFVHDCLTRIFVRWICNSDELMELLSTSLERLLCDHDGTISLVVLDGIASLFRLLPEYELSSPSSQTQYHYKNNPWHHRATTFFQISNLCKKLSSKYDVPFVVTNECTTRIPDSDTSNLPTNEGRMDRHRNQNHQRSFLEPALGLAWSQCVNCRFFVRRSGTETHTVKINRNNKQQQQQQEEYQHGIPSTVKKNQNDSSDYKKSYLRILRCVKAPHICSNHPKVEFIIDNSGVLPITEGVWGRGCLN